MSGLNDAAQALGANLAASLYGVSGQGIKIGIISDSFDANGGAAAQVSAGNLPAAVTVLSDSPSGTDEGQAMTELAYQIAPDASYYFASAGSSLQDFANAVTALQNAGCAVIIDDIAFPAAESFYQTGTVLDQAIKAAVAAGVSYFSAAGNDGNDYLQQGFTPTSLALPGIGQVTANDFGAGNPYLTLTIASGAEAIIGLQWAQPFASIGNGPGAGNSLAFYLLDMQGNILASATADAIGADPVQALAFTNTTNSTVFRLVVVENGSAITPTGQNFTLYTANGAASFVSPAAGSGTGDIYGHELLSGINVVGAVDYGTAPAFGGTPQMASYSSVGPGTILYGPTGAALPTPATPNAPSFASVSGSPTAVPGFLSFNGTSAAAPNAGAVGALMLQADAALTPARLSALMAQSAIPVAAPLGNAGAGLIQARAAVELAVAAGGTLWTAGGGGAWAMAADWSSGTLPLSTTAVMLGDDFGVITAGYTITVSSGGASAGALTLSAPAGIGVALTIGAGGTLAVGGASGGPITEGDLLVAAQGTLGVAQGVLSVSGSLNSNDGTVIIAAGRVTAGDFVQNAGSLQMGGGAGASSLTLGGATGLNETGGAITLGQAALAQASLVHVSAASLTIGQGGTLSATGGLSLADATLADGGDLSAQAATIGGGSATITQGGSLAVSSLSLAASAITGAPAAITIFGTVTDTGSLGAAGPGSGGTISIGSGGALTLGGAASGVSLALAGTGLIDFTASDASLLTTALTAPIYGLADGTSTVEFGALAYSPLDSAIYANGTLGLYDGSQRLAQLMLDPTAAYGSFALSAGAGDSLAVASLACFLAGTEIQTARGPRAVERLRPGDRVMTLDGIAAPITWIGRRRLSARQHPDPEAVTPVRIRAGAFAPGVPSRDLYLSPDHAIYAEDVLIPVKYLIDGYGIEQVCAERMTYYHLKLDRHDIILAEDLPVESYLDIGDRDHFEGGTRMTLHPSWGQGRLDPALVMAAAAYAPLRVTGAEVTRVRAALASRWGALSFDHGRSGTRSHARNQNDNQRPAAGAAKRPASPPRRARRRA
ncbi:Hint domain-containing protein [Acidisoma sp. C75]